MELGVIFIKKTVIISAIVTTILIAVIYILNNDNRLELISEDITNNNDVNEKEDEVQDEEGIEEQKTKVVAEEIPLFKEDPVKDFLTEKVTNTIERFFTNHYHI